jgi:hypothetical protein
VSSDKIIDSRRFLCYTLCELFNVNINKLSVRGRNIVAPKKHKRELGEAYDKERKLVLRRVVIKEELVAITEDPLSAMLLNQFLYWAEKRRDFDDFIREEKKRGVDVGDLDKDYGWTYKRVEDLASEILTDASSTTVRRRLQELVSSGFLDERRNPDRPFDRILQYRPDLVKIRKSVEDIGYTLENYPTIGRELYFVYDI